MSTVDSNNPSGFDSNSESEHNDVYLSLEVLSENSEMNYELGSKYTISLYLYKEDKAIFEPLTVNLHEQPSTEKVREIVLEAEEGFCVIEITDFDFPNFVKGEAVLALVVKDFYGRILFEESPFLEQPSDVVREIPLHTPPEEMLEIVETPPRLLPQMVYNLIAKAAITSTDQHEQYLTLDTWLEAQIGSLEAIHEVAEDVLRGVPEAFVALNELLAMLRQQQGDAFDLEAMREEASRIVDWLAMREEVEKIPDEEEENELPQTLPFTALDEEQVEALAIAAVAAAMDNEALAEQNLATVLYELHKITPIQVSYNMAKRALGGSPEALSDLRRMIGLKPIQPRFWPSPIPKPEPLPQPFPKPEPQPHPKPKPWQELTRIAERLLRKGVLYACTYELLRQTPFGFESYHIDSVSSTTVCGGETLTINGEGFGSTKGHIRVRARVHGQVKDVRVTPQTWTDTQIEFVMPSKAVSGLLYLEIPWRTVTVCDRTKQILKGGNPISLYVPELWSELTVRRLGEEPSKASSRTELFYIKHKKQLIRQDVAQIEWDSKDAHLGIKIEREDRNGSRVQISSSPKGTLKFPSLGQNPPNALTKFHLEAKSRCHTQHHKIEVEDYHGTKAIIHKFTVNRVKSTIVKVGEKIGLAWSVEDAEQGLFIEAYSINTRQTYSVAKWPTLPSGRQEDSKDIQVQENTRYRLTVVGVIRDKKRSDLVTSTAELYVFTEPTISYFKVNKIRARYGDDVTFQWSSSGATKVSIRDARGTTVKSNLPNSGAYKHNMNSDTLLQETFELIVENELIPESDQRRIKRMTVNIKYLPSIKEFYLEAPPTRGQDGAVQPAQKGKDIEVSWGVSGTGSVRVDQQWRIYLRPRNANQVVYKISGTRQGRYLAEPRSGKPYKQIYLVNPKLGGKISVRVEVSNPEGLVTDNGSVTYIPPVKWFKFRVRLQSGYSFERDEVGRSEDEAKEKVRKLVKSRYTNKIDYIKRIG